MAQEGDPGRSLVRRTSDGSTYSRTYRLVDGRTVYYLTPGGEHAVRQRSLVATSPGLTGEWYGRLTDWGERLLKAAKKVESGPVEKRDITEDQIAKEIGLDSPIQITRQARLLALLMRKAGHLLVLAVLAVVHVVRERIMTGTSR
jgi:hypothetical protein